jgi:maleylacetoacetate isomerase
MKLYDYTKSTAAYRVRIALNLKGVSAESVPVNLLDGEQTSPAYKQTNPQGLVPTLATEQGHLSQSLAILEFLDEQFPEPRLLPSEPWQKAKVRSMAFTIACDIHPLNNLRVLKYLTGELDVSEEEKLRWYAHWITEGFQALEQQMCSEKFCIGEQISLADICLVPQMFNARRFNVNLAEFPKLVAIDKHLLELPEIATAAPEQREMSAPH